MKKYFSVMMMAVMALGFATVSTSCSSDDDNAPSTDNSAIIGNWGVVQTISGTNNIDWVGEMNFMANGTVSMKTEDASFCNWTLNGKNLEISNGTEKYKASIKYQDDTTLRLEYTQDGTNYTMLLKRMEYQATAKNLVGTWKAGDATIVNPDESGVNFEFDDIVFNADGTCVSDNQQGTWQLNGQAIVFTFNGQSITGVVTNYNTIEMTIEYQIDQYKVKVPVLRIN